MKEKALIFIGFRHKTESIKTAREEGFKTILLTRKILAKAEGLFDEIFEDNILDLKVMDEIIPQLKKKYRIKGIISNYEHYVVIRSYLAERFNIPSTSLYGAACSRNKAMQRHAFKFMKENIDHETVRNEKEGLKALKKLGGDIFLKNIAGIKSRLIFHIESEQELKEAFKTINQTIAEKFDEDLYNDYEYCNFDFNYPNPSNTLLAEKAEYGTQITISSLASNYTIWHAPSACDIYTAHHLGRKDSFLAFRILPSKVEPEMIIKAKKATKTAAKILGLRYCPIFTELIVKKNGDIKIIEIASRMGGYRPLMYKNAYNFNLNKLLVQSVIGNKVRTNKKAQNYVSFLEIFPEKEGRFEKIENLEKLEKDDKASEIEIMAEKDAMIGLAKYGNPPCLRFLIKGNSYNEVYEKSMEYQKLLKVHVK